MKEYDTETQLYVIVEAAKYNENKQAFRFVCSASGALFLGATVLRSPGSSSSSIHPAHSVWLGYVRLARCGERMQ